MMGPYVRSWLIKSLSNSSEEYIVPLIYIYHMSKSQDTCDRPGMMTWMCKTVNWPRHRNKRVRRKTESEICPLDYLKLFVWPPWPWHHILHKISTIVNFFWTQYRRKRSYTRAYTHPYERTHAHPTPMSTMIWTLVSWGLVCSWKKRFAHKIRWALAQIEVILLDFFG